MIITIEDYSTVLRLPSKNLRLRIFAIPENHILGPKLFLRYMNITMLDQTQIAIPK